MKLRVCTLFSGYDSQCMALDRLKEIHPEFDYELVAWAEIDKYAIQAHNAVYPQWSDRNYGDVSKIDWNQVPDFDLLTYLLTQVRVKTLVMQASRQVEKKVAAHAVRYYGKCAERYSPRNPSTC